jgi:hypothetical protein
LKKKEKNYLKLTDACHTKAKRINKTGITGSTSTSGAKGAYASGSFKSTIAKFAISFLLYYLLEIFDARLFKFHI